MKNPTTAADLEFLEETLLIQDLANLEFGISKQASLFDDLGLDSVGGAIKNFVSEHMKNSDKVPGGYFTSTVGIMLPAILSRVHPLLGIIYLIASQFGYDLDGAVKKIFSILQSKLDKEGQITSEEVTQAGKEALNMSSEASFCEALNSFIKEAKIQKEARGREKSLMDFFGLGGSSSGSSLPETPWLSGGGGVIQRIFGTLFSSPGYGKSRALWLLGGFAIWIVKTILVGAGMIAMAEGVSHMLGHKKPQDEKKPEENLPQTPTPEIKSEEAPKKSPLSINPQDLPPAIQNQLPRGTNKIWVVPLVGDGSIEDTLKIWTLDIYKNLKRLPNINELIEGSPLFNKMVQLLNKPSNIGKDTLVMPPQFTNRKQVVDAFIQDIKDSIK